MKLGLIQKVGSNLIEYRSKLEQFEWNPPNIKKFLPR